MDAPCTPTHAIACRMGLIVGEGCFSGDAAPALIVALHASGPQPLNDLRSVFGGRLYGPYSYADGRTRRVWVLRNRELQDAPPYLDRWLPRGRKREQYEAWRVRYAEYFAILRDLFHPETAADRSTANGDRWVT